jgi:hypothetical protein
MRLRKTVDTKFIMSLYPCPEWPEDRVREAVPKRIPLVEFLRAEHIPAVDRLWVALHRELLSDRLMRLFACDCAERALQHEREDGREPDPRSLAAVAVARRYAVGEATDEELEAAWLASWETARSSASYAARAAAWLASGETARSSASYAASYAALDAALDAAWYAVCEVEREWQLNHLAAMIEEDK